MATLYLIRHGKSEWNLLGKWTGWTDVHIIDEGKEEAHRAGRFLKEAKIHVAHLSELMRTHETFDELQGEITEKITDVRKAKELNERNYGVHTGKNKWEVKTEIGDEAFQNLRRGWDVHIPEGETLKMVYARVVPYFESEILPDLKAGHNVLVVSHGNTLRALVKRIEDVPEERIGELEIGTGEVYAYTFDTAGKMTAKEIFAENTEKSKV